MKIGRQPKTKPLTAPTTSKTKHSKSLDNDFAQWKGQILFLENKGVDFFLKKLGGQRLSQLLNLKNKDFIFQKSHFWNWKSYLLDLKYSQTLCVDQIIVRTFQFSRFWSILTRGSERREKYLTLKNPQSNVSKRN